MRSFHEFVTEDLAKEQRGKWLRLGYHPSSVFETKEFTWAFYMGTGRG